MCGAEANRPERQPDACPTLARLRDALGLNDEGGALARPPVLTVDPENTRLHGPNHGASACAIPGEIFPENLRAKP